MSNRGGDRYQEPADRPQRRARSQPDGNGVAPSSSAKISSRRPFSYADALSNPARAKPAPATSTSRNGKTETLRVRGPARTSSTMAGRDKKTGKSAKKGKKSGKSDRQGSQISLIIEQFPHLASLNQKFDPSPKRAMFFVIKSYGEDDVHKSIKYGLWSSTPKGNRKLNEKFEENLRRWGENHRTSCPIYLLFSVNQSKCFCGLARMETSVDFDRSFHAWAQDGKWTGHFGVRWLFIKDVPNGALRRITLPNNENKPVTFSRDTQELPLEQGREFLKIFMSYRPRTSILDDFGYYDGRQVDMERERAERRKKELDEERQRREEDEEKRRLEEEESAAAAAAAAAAAPPPEDGEAFYETAPPVFEEYQYGGDDVYHLNDQAEVDAAGGTRETDVYYYGDYDDGGGMMDEYGGFEAPPATNQPPPPVRMVGDSGAQTSFVVGDGSTARPEPPRPIMPESSSRMHPPPPPPPPPPTRPVVTGPPMVQQGIVQATPPTQIVYSAHSNGMGVSSPTQPVGPTGTMMGSAMQAQSQPTYYGNGTAPMSAAPSSRMRTNPSGVSAAPRAPMSWADRAGASSTTRTGKSGQSSRQQQGYSYGPSSLPQQPAGQTQTAVNTYPQAQAFPQANQQAGQGFSYYAPQQGQQY